MKKRMALFICVMALCVLSFSTGVFANSFDMTTAITGTADELTTQFWAIIGVVVPAILAIVGGKLVITKGISWFKSLTGRAG